MADETPEARAATIIGNCPCECSTNARQCMAELLAAHDAKRPGPGPTILEVVRECLAIIEDLPPDERGTAIEALHNFALSCRPALKCKPRGGS
jgi:hypothetical protein